MTHAVGAALRQPLAGSGRLAAQADTARLPRRPTLSEAGVDRDDEVAPGVGIDDFHRGDSGTFRIVFQRFGPLIKAIAGSHTRNPHDREELYQEISVRVWRRRAQYSAKGPLGAWINRIAHRVCYDWQKSRVAREANTERHAGEVLALHDADAVLEDPSTLLDRREFMDDLRRALARLPERQGRTFTLVHVNGYGISETARIMKVRRATVRSNLRHAANKLRQLMEDYGV